MNETPVEYRQRIFGTLGSHPPLEVLQQTPALLRDWMEAHATAKWKERASPDQWSAAQVLSHLAEGEIVFAYRIRMTARSSGASIQGFDQDVWMEKCTYLIDDPNLAMKVFDAVRQANLAYIRSLQPGDYENYGIHSERGKETVRDLLRMCAGHDLNHLRQIEERLNPITA